MFRSLSFSFCFLLVDVVAPIARGQDGQVQQAVNQPVASKRVSESRISFVAHHHSGEALWIVTNKAEIHSVNPLTLESIADPTGLFKGTVSSVGLLPDQSGMLVCSYVGQVLPVETAKWKSAEWSVGEVVRPVGSDGLQSIAAAPGGNAFALGTRNGRVALLDLQTGALQWNVSLADTPINCIDWSPDGKSLAACSGDWRQPKEPGFVYLLDPTSGDVVKQLSDHSGQVTQVAFARDGKCLASASTDSHVLNYDLQDLSKPPADWKRSSSVTNLKQMNDGRCVVSIYGGRVEVCDLRHGRPTTVFSGHQAPTTGLGKSAPRPIIRAVSVAPDGKHLVTTDFNGMAYVWSLSDAVAVPSEYDRTHWNADATADVFRIGAFGEADQQGRPVGWEDLSAFDAGRAQLRAGTLALSSADIDETTSIATDFELAPNLEYVTLMVRLRGPTIKKSDQPHAGGGVTVSFVDSEGRVREMPRIEPPYSGYRDWTNRLHTAKVLPGENKLRVGIKLTGATGTLEVARILVIPSDPDREATSQQSKALGLAIRNDDSDAIARLIKDDPRMLEMRTGASDNGTPLIRAAWSGSANVAAKLIELGADIEARDDNWNNTPLRWCCWWGTHEVAAVLISAGAQTRGASRMAQFAKTANGAAKRGPEDFDKVSKLIDEHEAKRVEEIDARPDR